MKKSSVAVACFLPGRAKDLSAPLYQASTISAAADLRRGSEAACLLGLRVRISPGVWMSVFSECCVLSGRGLCFRLITRPEESYRVWCVLSVIMKPR
jgi:hypothetical protein